MANFPQLIEEDMQSLTAALDDLLAKSDASVAVIVEKSGYLILRSGNVGELGDGDYTNLASLAAGSFMATQSIAGIIAEPMFTSVYQEGKQFSLLVHDVDEFSLLLVIFRAQVSVGAVKYFAAESIVQVAAQLQKASARAPGGGFDLADLNPSDAGQLFQRRPSPPPSS